MPHPSVPVVEMLWETHDPGLVLADRFGLADAGTAAGWVATTLAEHWGLRVDACDRIVLSDRNALAWVTTSSGRLLAKWSVASPRFPRLAQVARLTEWLHGHGLPVSAPVPASDGRLQVEVDDVSLSLQCVVVGELLDVEDPDQVRAAGAVLARLHDALADHPEVDRVVPADERPEALATRITDWLDSAGEHVPEVGRRSLRRLLDGAPADPPPLQLVHGDYRSSNVLCADAEVVAVLDLEETRLDHRIDELARSAVMLGTRFRDWGPVSADVRATFRSGYESIRPLTPVEASWWPVLVLWYSLVPMPSGPDPTGWGSSALAHLAELTGEG